MKQYTWILCSICFLSVVSGRLVPYYDLEDDFYSEIRNLLEDHLSRKVNGQVSHPREVPGWGIDVPVGQVSGVAVDRDGNPVIFHRGSRVWNSDSFNATEHFQESSPIKEQVVVTLDQNTGRVLHSWGSEKFFMPHGITIDAEGNVWLTDIALHQVLKFPPKSEVPSLTLGEKFQPGSDASHFCKPTAVAVASKGDVFVADGYCNARILHFKADGTMIGQYGHLGSEQETSSLNVPHGLTLNENLDLLCVADRENAKIVCIRAGLSNHEKFGEQIARLQDPNHIRIFDITFLGNNLLGVAGSEVEGIATGFTADIQQEGITDEWQPMQRFHNPHSVATDADGGTVYVAEVGPNRVWKFLMEPKY